jgi:hypothetical protein
LLFKMMTITATQTRRVIEIFFIFYGRKRYKYFEKSKSYSRYLLLLVIFL